MAKRTLIIPPGGGGQSSELLPEVSELYVVFFLISFAENCVTTKKMEGGDFHIFEMHNFFGLKVFLCIHPRIY